MPVLNGNIQVKGTLSANSMLFKEIISTSDMTRGVNINLMDGKVYYKIDDQNYFEFINKEEIEEMIAEGGGGTGDSTVIVGSGTVLVSSEPTYDVMNLVNTTFFSVNDSTKSYFMNLNFDTSTDVIKATWQIDKMLSSIYKNGAIQKAEYWVYPLISMSTYKNSDVLSGFSSTKFDNSALNGVDQTSIESVYFANLMEQSEADTTTLLDWLLISNTNDHTLGVDNYNQLCNRFFSLNQINFKMDISNRRKFISEFHKRIFNRESILYFFENYMNIYKYDQVSRLKLYFFDFRWLIHLNMFHLIDYVKTVFNAPDVYTNTLSQNILAQKADHPEITEQTKDYTTFDWDFDADELVQLIFDSDTNFKNNIDWSSMNISVSVMKQNLASLNDSNFIELDTTTIKLFNYYGTGNFTVPMDRMRMSFGETWVPLLVVDFPLDSYFYFMM